MVKFIDYFLKTMPEDFFPTLITYLSREYSIAANEAGRFHSAQQRHQNLSLRQRDAGDLALQETFEIFKCPNISLRSKMTRNSSYTYMMGTVESACLTMHRLPYRDASLRTAKFRCKHALSNQFFLSKELMPKEEQSPYIIMLHGPETKHGEELGFLKLALPDRRAVSFLEIISLPLTLGNTGLGTEPEEDLPIATPKPKEIRKMA